MLHADLVLEGGGVKGIGLVGALNVLEEHGYGFKRIAGTSAGALVGSLVASGISAERLHQLMRDAPYSKFADGGFLERSWPGKAFDLVFRQGFFSGSYLRNWLDDRLRELGTTTFSDLAYQDPERPLPPDRQFRLVMTASDISQGVLQYLPWDYRRHFGRAPGEQRVSLAVRASMAFPFFFRPVRLKTAGGETSWLLDGGMLSNYPIDVFDVPRGVAPRWPTFGVKLSARPNPGSVVVNKVTNTLDMTEAMLRTMVGFYDRMHIEDLHAISRTIFVDSGDVDPVDFDISRRQREELYERGREAATKFLSTWDFDDYILRYRT
jgi:NTE family protein